jgi:putative SOS response-associated peptidase YedK
MCFHNKLSKKALEIQNRYKAQFNEPFEPIYHASGFSHPKWAVITSENTSEINQYYWGLIPFWVKSTAQAKELRVSTLNAKSETVFELPSFRSVIGKKRCIVISDGFYEWMDVNKKKYPFHIGMKGGEIFSMAGIYDNWVDKETGEEIKTFSILTCEANPLMAKIHNTKKRMPLILPHEIEMDWLKNGLAKDEIKSFFHQFPEEGMEAWSISKRITSRSENPNVPEVFEKYDYLELQ